jgi:hypothetical protein
LPRFRQCVVLEPYLSLRPVIVIVQHINVCAYFESMYKQLAERTIRSLRYIAVQPQTDPISKLRFRHTIGYLEARQGLLKEPLKVQLRAYVTQFGIA